MPTVAPPQLLAKDPSAASLNWYVPPVTSPPEAATNMTLVNQSLPPGVPGGDTLFMRKGPEVSAALNPSQVPGRFIVVHAKARGAENVMISNTTAQAPRNCPHQLVKPLEQPRRVAGDSR